jgi:hypothetical protein
MMAAMRPARIAGSVAALVLLCGRAEAEPLVVVLDSPAGPPTAELVSALHLHAGGTALVRVGPVLAAGPLAAQVAQASAHAKAEGAALVVWIDAWPAVGPGEGAYVAYVVGEKEGRALLEVIRVRASERAAAARVIALKVGSIIDLLLAPAPAAAASGPDVARGIAADPPGPSLRAPLRVALGVEALGAFGVLGAGSEGPRGGAGLTAEVALERRGWRIGAFGALRWLSSSSAATDLGSVTVREGGAALGAVVLRDLGPLALGGAIEAGARLLSASGRAEDGRSDSALVATPVVTGTVGAQVALTPRLALGAAAGVETSLVRRRFLLLGEPAADLGRFRPVARLSLSWSLR